MSNEIVKSESGALGVSATDNPATARTGDKGIASPSLPAGGRRAELETMMREDLRGYYSGGYDREYAGILSGEPAVTGRQAEIERIMKTDLGRYYGEGLDKELQSILEDGEPAVSARGGEDPTVPMPAHHSRNRMLEEGGAGLVQTWEGRGGFETNLAFAQKAARDVVSSIGDHREQRVFLEHFDHEVPATARYAIYEELRAGRPTFINPASAGEVKLFATTEAGRALVAEWGKDAPEKVAILRYRAARLNDSMYDMVDADEFWAWLDEQGPATAVPLFKKLAA